MSDNPLYAELDRLRTELAANERVAARLEEQRAKAEERVRELEEENGLLSARFALSDYNIWVDIYGEVSDAGAD